MKKIFLFLLVISVMLSSISSTKASLKSSEESFEIALYTQEEALQAIEAFYSLLTCNKEGENLLFSPYYLMSNWGFSVKTN